jgi:hypothetical protein
MSALLHECPGVDDQGQIIVSTVTDSHAQDPSQALALV